MDSPCWRVPDPDIERTHSNSKKVVEIRRIVGDFCSGQTFGYSKESEKRSTETIDVILRRNDGLRDMQNAN